MDYGKILTRAFEVTIKNRALWFFGILLALFGEGGRSSFNFPSSGGSSGGGSGGGTGTGTLPNFGTQPTIPTDIQNAIGIIIISLCCFAIVWTVLTIILRFTSRGAVIGLVQELESDGTTPTVRRGFSIGWERFLSLFGIALIINIPLTLVSIVLILIALAPMLATIIPIITSGRGDVGSQLWAVFGSGVLGTLGLLCCIGLLLTIVSFVLHPLYQFFVRECVVKKRGAVDSIREGFALVRANLGSVAILYLLSIGISIGYGIVMFFVALIAIGIPAVVGIAVYFAANQTFAPAIIAGVILFIPIMLLLLFIGGLYLVFDSTLWTEGYLELTKPKESQAVTPLPANT